MDENVLKNLRDLELQVSNLLERIRSRISLIELDQYRVELNQLKEDLDHV